MKITRQQAESMGIVHRIEKKAKKEKADAEVKQRLFLAGCEAHGLPVPVDEYEFCDGRKWAFDWLFEGWLALEIEGNPWASVNGQKSRHFHGQGILDDMEKYNEAGILGYVVLRVTNKDVESGAAFALVKRALEVKGEQP